MSLLPLSWPRRYGTSKEIINVKTFVSTTQSTATQTRVRVKVSCILVQHAEQRVHRHRMTKIDSLGPY